MFIPTGGDEGPEWRDLDNCRTTEVEFGDGTKKTLQERDVLNSKPRRRLSQFWTGRSIFYLKGKAPVMNDKDLKDAAAFLSRPIPVKHDG